MLLTYGIKGGSWGMWALGGGEGSGGSVLPAAQIVAGFAWKTSIMLSQPSSLFYTAESEKLLQYTTISDRVFS